MTLRRWLAEVIGNAVVVISVSSDRAWPLRWPGHLPGNGQPAGGELAKSEGRDSLRLLTSSKARTRAASVLAFAVAVVTVLSTADPAQAALSGSDWTARALPAGYFISDRTPFAPVSCVPGTQFCMTVANDTANILGGNHIGEAVLVTTNAGQAWTGYQSLPPAFFRAIAISCVSASVCWAAGQDLYGEPQVAVSADGGHTWTDKTPGAWANATWSVNSIDCVSADTCWLAGTDNPSGQLQEPVVIRTTSSGAAWTFFTNLPTFETKNPYGTYGLNGISCASPTLCVAVGDLFVSGGTASVIMTDNGGITWTRLPLPRISTLYSISCVPAAQTATCFTAGGTGTGTTGGKSVILMSRNGGRAWTTKQTFDYGAGFNFNSISCSDASHCWTAWAGSTEALDGTADAGTTWSTVTSDTADEYGSVSCLSITVCVATTDNRLWVTTDDGGLSG
jgi:hypothetical protein